MSGAIVLAVFYYVIFSLLFNTDVEKQLSRENSAYRSEYYALLQKQRLLADEVRHLRSKDDEIYRQIFHSEAPEVDPAGILVADTDSDDENYSTLVLSNRSRLDSVEARTARIEDAFQAAFARLSKKDTIPPMCLPVRKLSYVMTGAGIGMKTTDKRNFEAGILTDSPAIVEQAMTQFDDMWIGRHCKTCKRKDFCPDPIV